MTGVWAHRGASAAHPGNSIAAFAAAVELGADGVELDVRRTADGAAAVLHDPFLPDGRLLADVRSADLPATVPLLDAALDACGDLVVNIEIKDPPELADVVVADVRHRGIADRVIVSSFDLATIDRVRAMGDDVPTALLVLLPPDPDLIARTIETCRQRGHTALHPHELAVDERLVGQAHAAGLALNTWTVDDPDRVLALARLGVDAIVTNVPDVALRALGR